MDYSLVGQQSGSGYLLHRVLFCKRRSITTNATLNVVLAKYPERHGESGGRSVALDSEDVSYTDHELQLALLTLPWQLMGPMAGKEALRSRPRCQVITSNSVSSENEYLTPILLPESITG